MPDVRRILVAVDPAFAQSRMLELATRIASEIPAEIDALLVQDAALMTAADLPFAQEILAPTGARRGLTREGLDIDFRILARKLELRIEALAGRAGLRWTLRSVRGDPIAEIVAAAAQSELLMLGLPRGMAFDAGAMRRIAQQAQRPAVFLGDLASPTGGISVLDGDAELQGGLQAILDLLARAFPGAPAIYRSSSVPEIGDLRRRTTLVLPTLPPS
jgi:hypothetical protein